MTANLASDHNLRTTFESGKMATFSDAFLLISWIVMTFAVGNLWLGVPRDYYEYLPWYDNLTAYFDYTQSRFEPGFYTIAWIFRYVFDASFNLFIGFIAAVALGIKFWLFKRYLHYPIIGVLLYIAIFFPIHEYTQYRAALSLSFGYLAVHFLLEKRWISSIVLFIVATSLHGSVIILFIVAVGGYLLRGNKAAFVILSLTLISSLFFSTIRDLIEEFFSFINPLTSAYLSNLANLEDVSIFSVNNILLIAMCFFAVIAGYYQRTRYHMIFLTIAITSITPIILLSDSPIIAQRAKEVLHVAVIFLVCRSQFRLKDTPVLAFAVGQALLLLYLRVREGVLFS